VSLTTPSQRAINRCTTGFVEEYFLAS